MTVFDPVRVSLSRRSVSFFRRCCLATTALLAVSASVGAASAAGATLADWQMNEPSGSTTMLDSSGSNLHGTIGAHVVTGVVTDGATGYRWFGPDPEVYTPERLVTVTSPLLNPGTDDYAVTLRLYTGAGDQNILQKGQAKTAGGMFKIDMVKGIVICLFRGSEGSAGVRSSQVVWDNSWHTIRCERRANAVTLTIDGGTPKRTLNATGKIANTWELSIGGKSRCDGTNVQCDYFVGRMDYVLIERSAPGDTTKPQVTITAPQDGSTVKRGTAVGLAATASDNVAVARVDFKVNGSLKCSDTEPPYTCSWTPWNTLGTKNTIRAIAYDAAGNSASDTIYIYTG